MSYHESKATGDPSEDTSHHGEATPVAPRGAIEAQPLAVLLVEDDADHRFLTQRELERSLHCRVVTATTGAATLATLAAAQADSHPFDVVVLDNGLPDMTGLEVLLSLRERGDRTPVILVAGQGSEAIAVEALRRGANDYMVKAGDYLRVFPEVIGQVIKRAKIQRRNEHLEAEHVRFARLAALGEVAAGIAHEIRNPISVIIGMATLIRDHHEGLSTAELRQCASAIADNCLNLNRVLEQVLRDAQASHRREALSMAEIVEETVSFLGFDANFRFRVAVEYNFETPGFVHGDRAQLKQVLINLFRNAEQAIQIAGLTRGDVRVGVVEEEPGLVVTRITDSGNGIPAEVLPRIFESGYSTKLRGSAVEGSGLGLNISRRIIDEHGGRLWAEPNPAGGGAQFCIALPRLAAPTENDDGSSAPP